MGNYISNSTFSRFVIFCTLGSFTVTTITPSLLSSFPSFDINANDINFGIRMGKLIEKTKKHFSAKNSNKLIDVMFDIKNEVEGYTGQKLNIESSLNKIEQMSKAKGKPVPKAQMKEMRRRLKKADKRHNHKAMYMANCIEFDLPFNAEEESFLYEMVESAEKKHDHDDDRETELPLRVTIGVTMSLVGLFLYVVPFPICKAAAPWVLDVGLGFLLDQGVTEYEDRKKEDRQKKDGTNIICD